MFKRNKKQPEPPAATAPAAPSVPSTDFMHLVCPRTVPDITVAEVLYKKLPSWTVEQMKAEYDNLGYADIYSVLIRKSDGVRGTMQTPNMYTDGVDAPLMFFNWQSEADARAVLAADPLLRDQTGSFGPGSEYRG